MYDTNDLAAAIDRNSRPATIAVLGCGHNVLAEGIHYCGGRLHCDDCGTTREIVRTIATSIVG